MMNKYIKILFSVLKWIAALVLLCGAIEIYVCIFAAAVTGTVWNIFTKNMVLTFICGIVLKRISEWLNTKFNIKTKEKISEKYLKYSFIDNAILLKTEAIEKNGFREVWRQQNKSSIQILCYNERTEEFKAFDRFQWMDEKMWYGVSFNEDLWTPIKLHFAEQWLKEHMIKEI